MATVSQTVSTQALDQRLGSVSKEAASLLPAELGGQLLQLVKPESLSAMAAAILVWAGAHLFGVGEWNSTRSGSCATNVAECLL